MTKKQRYQYVIDYFEAHLPEAETELVYDNPFQLLVAVILSAQCTDKRINLTTPELFRAFPDAEKLALADEELLLPYIKSVTYPYNKARHLLGMARMLVEEFDGKVPLSVPELMRLPGVGRKTANVITSVLDQQPNMAVDTHVFRVSARIGLTTNAKNPLQAEVQLTKGFPSGIIHKAHHWLILHGRYVCVARSPKCGICGLKAACRYYQALVKKG
jgi:endonuclease-3